MNTHFKLKATRAAKSSVIVNFLCGCKLDGMITREMVVFGNIQRPVFKIVYNRMGIVSVHSKEVSSGDLWECSLTILTGKTSFRYKNC